MNLKIDLDSSLVCLIRLLYVCAQAECAGIWVFVQINYLKCALEPFTLQLSELIFDDILNLSITSIIRKALRHCLCSFCVLMIWNIHIILQSFKSESSLLLSKPTLILTSGFSTETSPFSSLIVVHARNLGFPLDSSPCLHFP